MATADQIKALIGSHGSGDDARFRAVAMQIAAASAKRGRKKLAEELRDMIDAVPRPSPSLRIGPARAVPIAAPPKELAGLVLPSFPKTRLSDMVLDPRTRGELERVVGEYRQRERLRQHGLEPRRRLLLVGPPGVGKTMTADALAGETGLPLMAVQLHALISKFMGETAVKLHAIFEAMEATRGVYFFDEFDAIGAVRGAANDVGEIRRVLNSFLGFLERHDADGLVVAATNLLPMLDEALFRRFDAVLRYGLPGEGEVEPLVRNRLSLFDTAAVDWKAVVGASAGLGHAEIVRAAEEAAKGAVLAGRTSISGADLLDALSERRGARPDSAAAEARRP